MKSLEDLYIQAQVNAIFKKPKSVSYLSVEDVCIDLMATYMEKQSDKKITIIIKARHPVICDIFKVIQIENFMIDPAYLEYAVESYCFICENKTYLSLRECLV
jgi:hypothetical protein